MIDKSKYAIDMENVTVKYQEHTALLGATIAISHGTLSGVIGMNGAGKSTLFKVIMGLISPSAGNVRVCNSSPKEAQKIGCVAYVPQNEVVDWDFPVSVYDVVMMGLYGKQNVFRDSREGDEKKVREALEKVGMAEYAGRQIGELSGGQRKRVFVARALAQGAEILLLDEPFAGLDAKSEHSLTMLLVSLKNAGKTVIISTHELTSLSEYCDHVALVKKTVLAYGKTEDCFTRELVSETFDGIVHHVKFDK